MSLISKLLFLILLFELTFNCEYYKRIEPGLETGENCYFKKEEKENYLCLILNKGEKLFTTKEVLYVLIPEPWFDLTINRLDYLESLFKYVDIPIKYYYDYPLKNWRVNNSVIITFSGLNGYFRQLELVSEKKFNIGVIHLGDHYCNQDYTWYEKTSFVFRNYYCPEVLKKYKNSYFLPLGWYHKSMSNLNSILPGTERAYFVGFLGKLSDYRSEVEGKMQTFINKYNVSNVFQYSNDGLGLFSRPPTRYYIVLGQLVLTLCLHGDDEINETNRIYEALESGSIPILEQSDFVKVLGDDTPLMVTNKFGRKFKKWMSSLLDSPEDINNIQQNNHNWWKEYKTELFLTSALLIRDLF